MRSRTRWASVDGALSLIVGSIVVYSYWTYLRLPWTRPRPGDYAESTAYVRAHFQPGDLIDANPFWAVRVREYLGDLPLANFRHVEREDLSRYGRLWLFSLFGAERRRDIRDGLAASSRLIEERQFGRINVRLYRLPESPRLLYDFRERLEEAAVSIEQGGARRSCNVWQAGRWRCSPAYWNYVGREILEIDGEPRAVVWAHPVGGGVLAIRYAAVPLGRTLVLRTGFDAAAVRYGGPPVTLLVEIDGRPTFSRLQDPRPGFFPTRMDTREFAGGTHEVTFKVSTANDRWRHFCFSAEARE